MNCVSLSTTQAWQLSSPTTQSFVVEFSYPSLRRTIKQLKESTEVTLKYGNFAYIVKFYTLSTHLQDIIFSSIILDKGYNYVWIISIFQPSRYYVLTTVHGINIHENWIYQSCNMCRQKLDLKDDLFWCNICRKNPGLIIAR